MTVVLAAGAAVAAGAGPRAGIQAQTPPDSVWVSGRVVDATTGAGVSEAQVSFRFVDLAAGEERAAWAGPTDDTGFFETDRLPAGRYSLTVEALGYGFARDSVELTGARVVDVRVEVSPRPLELPPLVVVSRRRSRLETAGFYERRRAGQGYTLTREEVEAHQPSRVTDVFRMVPGVRLVRPRGGGDPLVQFRGCYADVALDGVPLQGPVALDQILTVNDIEAVEVHSGTFFPTRPGVRSCGTVMIWTREGISGEAGHGLSLKRLLAVGVFVALSLLLAR